MTIRKIYTYPAPCLLKVSKPIKEVDDEIRELLDDMAETMYAAPGVGLAAPQIGVNLRAIVIDCGKETDDGKFESDLIQMANPEIVHSEGELVFEEGCLSCPDFSYPMNRKSKLVARGLDRNGNEIEIHAEGLLAVAFQQEIDHLNGKLILDEISRIKRDLYKKKLLKKKKQEEE